MKQDLYILKQLFNVLGKLGVQLKIISNEHNDRNWQIQPFVIITCNITILIYISR